MSKKTKRQRLKRDPMNQTRGKVRAWAKRAGAVLDTVIFKNRRPMLVGFLSGHYHPNSKTRRFYQRRYDGNRFPYQPST
jgi:hypothetical protein